MKLNEHPHYADFADWFAAIRPRAASLDGVYDRVAGPRHTTADTIVSGEGAFRGGGRWNPPGVMRVLYLSRKPETALREAHERLRRSNSPVWKGIGFGLISILLWNRPMPATDRNAIAAFGAFTAGQAMPSFFNSPRIRE